MDKQDIRILQALSENARISGADIARKVNLSLPAVTSRLRKLDHSGMIDKYTVRFNRKKLNLNLLAFIQVWVDHSKASNAKELLVAMPEVLECHHAAGDYDLLLKVLVSDTAALEQLLVNKIKSIKSITRTSTTIILNTYKEELNTKTDLL
jgi:Lrp/AsnC family transcriptional regulator, leucine-responsive regulatory protein